MRQDLYRAQRDAHEFVDEIFPFITPFVPEYASAAHRAAFWPDRPIIDYTYEREWRLASDLQFEFHDLAFIFLSIHEDLATMPAQARHGVQADKWIIVSNYRKIEELWPQHNLGDI